MSDNQPLKTTWFHILLSLADHAMHGTAIMEEVLLRTGGAIRAPGRADIFMGIGETVGILAGRQHAEGRLFYFFVRSAATS